MLQIGNRHGRALLTYVAGLGSRAVTWFKRVRARTLTAARQLHRNHSGGLRWAVRVVIGTTGTAAIIVALVLVVGLCHVYFDRTNLPDIEPFARFEFPAIGHVYDTNGQPLVELAKEHRQIVQYGDIPPIVRDAILAAEDKNFFSHNGVDYSRIPRVLSKVRVGTLLTRITRLGRVDEADSLAMLRQGGSTISQQLVRAYFLRNLTDAENSNDLRPGALSYVIGARSAKKLVRKIEEIRLSLWMERQMRERFGSKRRAKEEILARYASFLYMGDGQYGFAAAAEHYFGRPLASFTAADADKAALLAGIAKWPRVYAPNAPDVERILHRRNQILGLMVKRDFISPDIARAAEQCPILVVVPGKVNMPQAPAVIESVLRELKSDDPEVSVQHLLLGRIQVYSTVDTRVQHVVNEALEHGLLMYEKRHPSARGVIQGSVVVLRNRNASILAESGGREFYKERSNSYSDFNRAAKSLRQPGSAMKPFVYLAAFRQGIFNLESMVPDAPISVPDRGNQDCEMDLKLRRPIQRHDFPSGGASRIPKCRRDLDHDADWNRKRAPDITQLRTPDSFAAVCQHGIRRIRSELVGTGECLPHDGVGYFRRAARDPKNSWRIGKGGLGQRRWMASNKCGRQCAGAHSGRAARCRALAERHGTRA